MNAEQLEQKAQDSRNALWRPQPSWQDELRMMVEDNGADAVREALAEMEAE